MVLILNRSLRICGHCQHVSCNALTVTALHCLVLYDTRCYFNVRSKADMSQLNLYHTETTTKKCKTEKKLK